MTIDEAITHCEDVASRSCDACAKEHKQLAEIEVILSWDDDSYCCQFKRGRDQEDWQEMSRGEQVRAVGAMFTMGKMFSEHIKKEEK